MENSASPNPGPAQNFFRSPVKLGQHWQSQPAAQNDAPAPQALPSESILGPFPWFCSGDDLLPFDADCFDER